MWEVWLKENEDEYLVGIGCDVIGVVFFVCFSNFVVGSGRGSCRYVWYVGGEWVCGNVEVESVILGEG